MADFEIIDLTDSPPSSPPPRSRSIRRRSRRILSFRASASSRTVLFKIIRRPNENPNSNSEYLTRHVVPWIPPTLTGQISQAVNEFHSTMHGGEIWTQHEHEEFVKGLGNCGASPSSSSKKEMNRHLQKRSDPTYAAMNKHETGEH
ncbi:uncharacterized protein G2W53_018813 [Senna tora]|uniref:Uncharacterized protein n=1 Tax=Senna tora TaxID=362788 RepID=A0A834TTS3_9FABA|nr:uncharacterized protein G2W53_018813 [Senna tora]